MTESNNSETDSAKLPKCPVPGLEQTIDRYVEYASVICSEEELRKTQDLVSVFLQDVGPRIQAQLEKKAENDDNWVNEHWIEDMYLGNRACLPGFSNAAYIFPERKFRKPEDFIKYAACLVKGVCDFKSLCDSRKLPADRATGKDKAALCMDQYWRVFSSYREAHPDLDTLLTQTHDKNDNNEHIIVICNNQQFVVNTMMGGKRMPVSEIFYQLSQVQDMATKRSKAAIIPIGSITAAERNTAAEAMAILREDETNSAALNWIRSSSFVLCLDRQMEPQSISDEEDFKAQQARHILNGFGPKSQGNNRWYEKTLQFIVSDNGVNGLNIEHTVSEGIVMIRMVEHALKIVDAEINKKMICEEMGKYRPKPLTWHVAEELQHLLGKIKNEYQSISDDLDFKVLIFNGYGRNYAKSKHCSPDAFIQLVLQLAYFKRHGKLTSTYESASTRRFRYGRVDNIRANTPEALQWVQTMESPHFGTEEKISSFRAAVEKQTKVQVENISGYGIDNHLVALKRLSDEDRKNLKGEDMFSDPIFNELARFPLTTSSVPTGIAETFLCYGPVVTDGYGCAYNPGPDSITFAISSFYSDPHTDSIQFKEAVRNSLDDIKTLLDEM